MGTQDTHGLPPQADAGRLVDALAEPWLRAVVQRGTLRVYEPGVLLIREGASDRTLYVILQGRVKVFSTNERGREIVMDVHGAGGYVGEMAIDGGLRTASVVTLDRCVCAVVTAADLRRAIAEDPDAALQFIKELVRRLRLATVNIKAFALEHVADRVLRLVRHLAVHEHPEGHISGPITQREIAERVGCVREMVAHVLYDLQARGLIRRQRQRLILLRQEGDAARDVN